MNEFKEAKEIYEDQIKEISEEIDTGSFLKGYAVEKAKETMRNLGVTSAFISSISSIETINTKPDRKNWTYCYIIFSMR